MRVPLLMIFFFFCQYALAQTTGHIAEKRSYRPELGLFVEQAKGPFTAGVNLSGLQYIVRRNEYKSYRFFLAYGHLRTGERKELWPIAYDTVAEVRYIFRSRMPMLGAAVQAQRNFYRNIYLFAALEARAGYGKRELESSVVKYHRGLITEFDTYKSTVDYGSLFYAGFVPTLGIKAQFKRVNLGAEAWPGMVTVSISNNFADFDMTLGNLSARLFLNYAL